MISPYENDDENGNDNDMIDFVPFFLGAANETLDPSIGSIRAATSLLLVTSPCEDTLIHARRIQKCQFLFSHGGDPNGWYVIHLTHDFAVYIFHGFHGEKSPIKISYFSMLKPNV